MRDFMKVSFKTLDNMYMSDELKLEFKTSLSYMTAIDYQTYMLDDILQKVDRSTMIHSLEGREPFLDHRIIEYAAQLPDEYKYFNGVKKRILRDITYQYVPKTLLDRQKMGFAIPLATWLANDLRELVETHLSKEVIEQQGIFNWMYIEKIKTSFYNGKKEFDTKLWYILMFQMWFEKWGN
jgi:asparagine synthase (glutamine-hydrolysing)